MAYFHVDARYDEARYDESNYDNIAITPVERLLSTDVDTQSILVEVLTVEQQRSTDTATNVGLERQVSKDSRVTTPFFVETSRKIQRKTKTQENIDLATTLQVPKQYKANTVFEIELLEAVKTSQGITLNLSVGFTQETRKKAGLQSNIRVSFTEEITKTEALEVTTLIPFFLERRKNTRIKDKDEYSVKVSGGEEYNVRVKEEDNFLVSRKQQ